MKKTCSSFCIFGVNRFKELFHQFEIGPELPPHIKTHRGQFFYPHVSTNVSMAYTFLHKATLPTQIKSFSLNVLNKTAPSIRSLCRVRLAEFDVCDRCPMVADNYQVNFESNLPYLAFIAFSELKKNYQHDSYRRQFSFFCPV